MKMASAMLCAALVTASAHGQCKTTAHSQCPMSERADARAVAMHGHSKTIVDVAVEAGNFKTLTAALGAAGLVDVLKGDGPFTVFAPTDEAFAALPEGTVESLLEPENKDKLTAVLTYHVVPGRVFSDQAIAAGKAATLQGGKVKIAARDGAVHINGATVTHADIQARNGVIHVIDTVLMPPMNSDD